MLYIDNIVKFEKNYFHFKLYGKQYFTKFILHFHQILSDNL